VLGLGEVGLPTAIHIAKRGIDVFGYDLRPQAIERAKTHGLLKASNQWQAIPPANIYVVCVYAGLKNGDPDFSSIFDVCCKINEKVVLSSSLQEPLVSIESTVIPGICRSLYEEIFKKHVSLIHVPHRFWAEDPVKHGVRQRRVIGAVNEKSLELGLEFYKKILGIPLHKVSSVEIAEMCKIAENVYRYIQIAFAEELRIVCAERAVDFDVLREACNTKWNVKIAEARDGIKGHCLTKDAKFFVSLAEMTKMVKNALLVDEGYQKWLQEYSRKET
jgi:nucleotide sugar dehydrogenase